MSIIESDLTQLEHYRKKYPDLPESFHYDKIDGVKNYFMVVIVEENKKIPASICWLYTNRIINRVVLLKSDEAEIKHALTLKKYRGKNVFSKLLEYAIYKANKKGYKRLYSIIEKNNKISKKVFQKCGFEVVSKINLKKLFGLRMSKLYFTPE